MSSFDAPGLSAVAEGNVPPCKRGRTAGMGAVDRLRVRRSLVTSAAPAPGCRTQSPARRRVARRLAKPTAASCATSDGAHARAGVEQERQRDGYRSREKSLMAGAPCSKTWNAPDRGRRPGDCHGPSPSSAGTRRPCPRGNTCAATARSTQSPARRRPGVPGGRRGQSSFAAPLGRQELQVRLLRQFHIALLGGIIASGRLP